MSVMDVCWLVDEILQERQYDCGYPSLPDAARAAGHQVYVTKYVPFSTAPDPAIPWVGENKCVVTHGSHEFVRQVKKHFAGPWQPTAYHKLECSSYSAFAPHLGAMLLNDDFILLPYGEVIRRGHNRSLFRDADTIFVKPNAVTKEFAGRTIHEDDFDHEIHCLSRIEQPAPDTLCVVAAPKKIKAEFRYVIADGEVVTGSEYRWGNVLDIRIDTLPECDALAQRMAKLEWQPDRVYTCDVAWTDDQQAKIVELNTFSCSGLYACDTHKIVEKVSLAAWKEFIGED